VAAPPVAAAPVDHAPLRLLPWLLLLWRLRESVTTHYGMIVASIGQILQNIFSGLNLLMAHGILFTDAIL
jgi:hypothetical protein